MLPLSKITLKLHFTTLAHLPYWMGSAFRGVFGTQIRRAVCNNLDMTCEDCKSKDSCLYYYLYERKVAKRGHAPPQRPIILIPPFFGKVMEFEKDGRLDVELLFFGDFRKYLPHALLGLRLSGQQGIGAERHYRMNRFEISKAICNFSGKEVFDGGTINLTNLHSVDVSEMTPYDSNTIKIGFKTPYTGPNFPLSLDDLLNSIRNRLIRFVNEYGTEEKISNFSIKGEIKNYDKHFHRLERRSARSDKRLFKGYTGIVEYNIKEIDDVGKWLLSVGLITGVGPDSSFGCGFLQTLD